MNALCCLWTSEGGDDETRRRVNSDGIGLSMILECSSAHCFCILMYVVVVVVVSHVIVVEEVSSK